MPEGVMNASGEVGFQRPEEIPWSELGPHFIEAWGHDENGRLRAEHWEIEGQSGSGKSYLAATAMQQRAERWGTAILAVLTKQTDDSIPLLGWPHVTSYAQLQREKYLQAVVWPSTTALGEDREKHHEKAIYDLLANLWPKPGQQANTVIYLDEIRYIESLSRRLKKLVRQYWREGRSHGISIIAGAQRPLEMVRDMHSEARWKAVFAPADEADMERFAQLLGPHREWEPVLRSLDQTVHQFVLKNTFTGDAYITWVDEELRPLPSQSAEGQRKARGGPEHIYGGRKRAA
jgi:hypothetical protein